MGSEMCIRDRKDPALTELGESEALKGAEELKKFGYVCIDFTVVNCHVLTTKCWGRECPWCDV